VTKLLPLILIAACSRGGTPKVATPGVEPSPAAADVLQLGDFRAYPRPSGMDWATEPLDDARFAKVSAELACVGRIHHGNPGEHTLAASAVLAQHRTTGDAVMAYGVTVNADPARATALGERIAAAAESCR
jgi:hypothetical protein